MAHTVLVTIDIEKLRGNLARADQRDVSVEEAQRFLADAGFKRTDAGWLVSEENLGHLDPSEVLSAEIIDE
ncbi:MAG TPA: hypothetical protein VHY37_02600 [Tepidisphaeraceae bacterium]|jgi:hypothetical protein|nr:hypothetical protein [Tepidisphaeraceae bacterium]